MSVEFGMENNPKSNGKKKEGKGRRKVEMKRIEDKSKRHVTFSKRKKGLFNKAGELSVLTGAEIAGIIVSSNGKVFSFGSPDPDAVIRRYLGVSGGSTASSLLRSDNGEIGDYLEAKRRMEAEKMNYVNNTRDTNVDGGEERRGGCWWETAVGGLDLEELEKYMKALYKLKQNVDVRMNEMISTSTVGCNFSSLMDMDVEGQQFFM